MVRRWLEESMVNLFFKDVHLVLDIISLILLEFFKQRNPNEFVFNDRLRSKNLKMKKPSKKQWKSNHLKVSQSSHYFPLSITWTTFINQRHQFNTNIIEITTKSIRLSFHFNQLLWSTNQSFGSVRISSSSSSFISIFSFSVKDEDWLEYNSSVLNIRIRQDEEKDFTSNEDLIFLLKEVDQYRP